MFLKNLFLFIFFYFCIFIFGSSLSMTQEISSSKDSLEKEDIGFGFIVFEMPFYPEREKDRVKSIAIINTLYLLPSEGKEEHLDPLLYSGLIPASQKYYKGLIEPIYGIHREDGSKLVLKTKSGLEIPINASNKIAAQNFYHFFDNSHARGSGIFLSQNSKCRKIGLTLYKGILRKAGHTGGSWYGDVRRYNYDPTIPCERQGCNKPSYSFDEFEAIFECDTLPEVIKLSDLSKSNFELVSANTQKMGIAMRFEHSHGGCFIAGTKVETPKGNKNIEDIQEGDEVYSYDTKKKQITVQKVTKIFRRDYPYDKFKLSNGDWLGITTDHPIFINGDFVLAENVSIGQTGLATLDVNKTILKKNEIQISNIQRHVGRAQVYNIRVDQTNTYFANGILVHNR